MWRRGLERGVCHLTSGLGPFLGLLCVVAQGGGGGGWRWPFGRLFAARLFVGG